MFELFVPLFGLALLDSINPSALGVTMYLLTHSGYTSRVLIYIAGIFLAYLTLGILIMLGLDVVLTRVQEQLSSPLAYAIQGIVGLAMFLYGCFAPSKKQNNAKATRLPKSLNLGAVFVLGLSITVLEFPTAFPYLGAIGMLTNAKLPPLQWVAILVVYNLIFVLPPFLLLVLYRFFSTRLQDRLEAWRERWQSESRATWLTILAIIGFLLTADSLVYFDFFGLIPE